MNNEGYQITYTGEEVQELLDKAGTAVQTETDPTVPSWAKAEEKPTYTATEVGALPDDTELFSGSYNDLTDKPTIPDSLSDLSDDSTHRLVTDAEKTAWNGKSDFSGSYNDLTDKPTIPDAQIQSDWNQSNTSAKDYIKNKPTIPDISNCIQKSSTSGLVKNDGTVDTNTYLTSAPVSSVNGQTGAVSLTLGDTNVIETVKVNGSALTPDANKAVDITVPSVSGKEDTTNKVTSLSSSSTDTQYPSAKATYTYINTMLGDIETLLSNI